MPNKKIIIGGAALAAAAVALVISSATASSAPHTLTAAQFTTKLQTAGLPVNGIIDYTATNDPNHLLGRPGGYTSKTAFVDSRINELEAEPGSIEAGGSVEVFSNHAEAQARVNYISKMEQIMTVFGNEYDYVNGNTVLRVSSLLTPAQAATYENAAK